MVRPSVSYVFALFGPTNRTAGLLSLLAAADMLTQTAPAYPINALVSTAWADDPVLRRETHRIGIGLLPVDELPAYCKVGKHTSRPDYFRPTYSIFHLYNLTQFEFVLYLDTDLTVLRNIDTLLEYRAGDQLHVEELRTPTGCQQNNKRLRSWNTGVWGIRPNRTRFELVARWLREDGKVANPCGIGFQSAAQAFFLQDKFAPTSVQRIGCEYNMKADIGVSACAAKLGIPLSAVAIVHWSGTRKPHLRQVRSLPEDGGTPDFLERRALDIYLGAYERADTRVRRVSRQLEDGDKDLQQTSRD